MATVISYWRHGYSYEPPGHAAQYFIEYHSDEGHIKTYYFGDDYHEYKTMLGDHNKGDPWWTLPEPGPPPEPEPTPPEPIPPTPEERYLLTVITTPSHCKVELYYYHGALVAVVTTGSDGRYTFMNLPRSEYDVIVSKEGYNTVSRKIPLNSDREESFTLTEESIWDWIIGFVIGGFESILGWQAGTLLTTLGKTWDLITNYGGKIIDFFADAAGSIIDFVRDFAGDIFDWLNDNFSKFIDWLGDVAGDIAGFVSDKIGGVIDWVQDHAGDLFDWLNDNFSKFIDWINQVGGDIAGFVGDKIAGVVDFVTTKFSNFVDWLNDLPGSIGDYIGNAIGSFVDWTSDQLGGIWDGIQTWFTEAISGFVEAFFGGLNTGIEEAKGSPLHGDEPVKNPVLKGLLEVVREHRKKHGRDEITGEIK